jgi:thiol-disulfide isomerase/thioredoxin
MRGLTRCAAILLLCLTGCWQEVEQPLPRYRLKTGQHLVYETTRHLTYDGGSTDSSTHWDVWVTAKDPNGTAHLLILRAEAGDGYKYRSLICYSLSSSGQLRVNGEPDPSASPRELFPALPGSADQLRAGWASEPDEVGAFQRYRVSPGRSAAGSFVFTGQEIDPLQKIRLSPDSATLQFRVGSGMLEQTSSRYSQARSSNSQSTATVKLKSVEQMDHATLARLAADGPVCVAALDRNELLTYEVPKDLTLAGDSGRINAPLHAALARVTDPLTRELLNERLAHPLRSNERLKARAADLAAILNKPCPNFSLQGYDGRIHSLADYRGKVVAMDFWYRGCGWCIRAMPQVQQLATDFPGEDFVMLGMNKHDKDEDAQFVIRELGLTYPNLKAKEFCKTMRVTAFPTLILVDRQGIVREFDDEGWSPTLHRNIGAKIRALLRAPASQPTAAALSR